MDIIAREGEFFLVNKYITHYQSQLWFLRELASSAAGYFKIIFILPDYILTSLSATTNFFSPGI